MPSRPTMIVDFACSLLVRSEGFFLADAGI